MQSRSGHGRRGAASAIGLLIAVTVFGVLLMHSVPSAASMSTSTSGDHASMASSSSDGHEASTSAVNDSSIPVVCAEHDCPSAHHMTHPCVGTTVSWPVLTAPLASAEIDLSPTSADRIGGRTESTLGRAPPWTLYELDRSVTLRV